MHKTSNLPFCDTSILTEVVVYDHLNLVLAMPKGKTRTVAILQW